MNLKNIFVSSDLFEFFAYEWVLHFGTKDSMSQLRDLLDQEITKWDKEDLEERKACGEI